MRLDRVELVELEAWVVTVPMALMHPCRPTAEHQVAVCALENLVFVAYANRVRNESGLRFIGQFSICGTDGRFLCTAQEAKKAIIRAELDLAQIEAAKAEASYRKDLKRIRFLALH